MERIVSQYQVPLIRQRMTKEEGFPTEEEARTNAYISYILNQNENCQSEISNCDNKIIMKQVS
ncbi:MAG: hypothetical protein A3B74_05065 [Candidatus Kerfeldbacteria bacterium RIFCSPHIGHO2_02_FULL_42_14]|uniref:Uncharacterized protein n=1 Tax=Candidatus Kerfeldbacteria bacterium RIFCSPHIGHO2_02_FULL_42_14 TaxID=1798540 RepID=A0A1G2AVG0_9BACT|nr:MAG: hypothetical protein A3B74_05065 [Candidatus Kerfeldbacteria bacterium RIFCSPHIGHO2_02_FULL_42_14]OGY81379.1 MAG: hypothetical protein A3E60_01665 [Candidatus Kerfeldbacteria bacterium RIFCSPHIGHO2_12_FULL_42_13]OGY83233.1 MAG: hypothetical protein A3I91_03595 [Candidatus Kerfeldbacteria bacterium RIFCSPLOWO2_02_FULL_42_19]